MSKTWVAICFALACSASLAEESALLAWQAYDGVVFVTGGIGEEERGQIEAARRSFNFQVVMAEKEGAYVTGVRVTVTRPNGAKVLEVPGAGPFLLAKLPEGTYRVTATYDDREQRQDVVIRPGRSHELVFRW